MRWAGHYATAVNSRQDLAVTHQVVGIRIDKEETGEMSFDRQVLSLANRAATLAGLNHEFGAEDIILNENYLGAGYGMMGALEEEAIAITARTEGILLDPVYTGRAMGGLIDLIRWGAFTRGQRVLFWHTGGAPALFAYGIARAYRYGVLGEGELDRALLAVDAVLLGQSRNFPELSVDGIGADGMRPVFEQRDIRLDFLDAGVPVRDRILARSEGGEGKALNALRPRGFGFGPVVECPGHDRQGGDGDGNDEARFMHGAMTGGAGAAAACLFRFLAIIP